MKFRTHFLPKGIALLAIAATCIAHLSGASAFSTLSESTLQRLAQASSLSYLPLDRMSSSPYYDACKLEPITQVLDAESESGATIFRATDDARCLVVACRGSANAKNFGTNLRFNPVEATRLSQTSVPDDARVHEGFQTAAVGLWRELARPLEELVADPSSSAVTFTGHSLGAATAQLCATHYRAGGRGPAPAVVTFGGPRLCNAALARHLRTADEALAGCDVLHLVHSADPVLANNKKLWEGLGFENVGVELECDPHLPRVYGEGEAPKKLPFGNFAWNILDHCKYMVS